jgi:manganese/iron transport system permease protein
MMLLCWQLAALLSGSSVGLLGVYVVGLRMPFLGVGMAHAAMAGAVFAYLLGWPPVTLALGFALAAGIGMAWLTTTHTRADLGTVTSILLSLTMGLAFIGIGLNQGEMTPLLGLLWGSMLFVRPADLFVMSVLGVLLALFVTCCRRPLEALLFSHPLARACGLPERRLLMLFMVLAALLITFNLQIVGGLLMYSLLTNPAAAAFELGTSMRAVRGWAVAFGVAGTLGGFWLSYGCNLPTGSCIVLASTLLYALAVLAARRQVAPGHGAS